MRPLTSQELEASFWSRVDKKGPMHPTLRTRCWMWTGSDGRRGYGQFYAGRKDGRKLITLAHRWAYEQSLGPVEQGKLLCHHCDNILCVRPGHMFVGTVKDNSDDMIRKGRSARGERQGSSKLTEAQVLEIYRRAKAGERYGVLAKEVGVTFAHVSLIMLGKCWKHLGLAPHIPDSRNKAKKLTESDIIKIKSSPLRAFELAKIFDVSHSLICNIRGGKVWRHVHTGTP